jgi:hypothetical protein
MDQKFKNIKGTEDYRCPKCKCMSDMPNTLIGQTNPELVNLDSEPYYQWEETHQCWNCNTIYKYKNNS